ncbi:hypothetical protein [Streptomyces sp. NPDC046712]|uniref:hypothetical protein n=1 Tax=Streptomyces sp. NPDC046712 TaxID=3154802 RepID=UPI0033D60CE2
MAKDNKQNATLEEARAGLQRAAAEVNRVLGLQGLSTSGGHTTELAAFHSTISNGCSALSIGCHPV